MMTHSKTTPPAASPAAPLAGRKLPPVRVPEAVADPGLIRIGAAVGLPVKR